jgi:hypothetical protein
VILGKFWSRFDLQQRRNRKFLGDDQGCLGEQTIPYAAAVYVIDTYRYGVSIRIDAAAVQLCKFEYVGTGSKVPIPGQKYRFNIENLYKLFHM